MRPWQCGTCTHESLSIHLHCQGAGNARGGGAKETKGSSKHKLCCRPPIHRQVGVPEMCRWILVWRDGFPGPFGRWFAAGVGLRHPAVQLESWTSSPTRVACLNDVLSHRHCLNKQNLVLLLQAAPQYKAPGKTRLQATEYIRYLESRCKHCKVHANYGSMYRYAGTVVKNFNHFKESNRRQIDSLSETNLGVKVAPESRIPNPESLSLSCALCGAFATAGKDYAAVDVCDLCLATKRHANVELLVYHLQREANPVLAVSAEAVEPRPPHHGCICPHCNRLEHRLPAPDAPINPHLASTVDGLEHTWQNSHWRWRPIELPPSI